MPDAVRDESLLDKYKLGGYRQKRIETDCAVYGHYLHLMFGDGRHMRPSARTGRSKPAGRFSNIIQTKLETGQLDGRDILEAREGPLLALFQ